MTEEELEEEEREINLPLPSYVGFPTFCSLCKRPIYKLIGDTGWAIVFERTELLNQLNICGFCFWDFKKYVGRSFKETYFDASNETDTLIQYASFIDWLLTVKSETRKNIINTKKNILLDKRMMGWHVSKNFRLGYVD